MKRPSNAKFFVTLLLIATMLVPYTAFAAAVDGKSHFKKGMKYEAAEDWDKAVEEFALAVTDSPKNPEYRLHLVRALFNASQMYIKKGTLAANEKDYAAAYTAFRRAYAFDPTNELAKSEMERMVRLQGEATGVDPNGKPINGVKVQPAAFDTASAQIPQRLEKLRDLPFENTGIDLQFIIRELAKELDLNVLFDTESFRTPGRKTYIGLRDVSSARALDYIFMQEGLFFQKVGPRTIMVATQAQRVKFQQLVLRTFYLANAKPTDVAKVVQTAIPAQPGRSQTIVLTDDATNSITVRDTEENIKLIGSLIGSLDKDRAEVVMDVAIYEVNKTDLLQFGNQLGTSATLSNLGGLAFPLTKEGPVTPVTSKLPFVSNLIGTGFAFGLPVSTIAALQSKQNTKLIASTQIHAFNNEDSSARIGQRVPVQSAQFVTGDTGTSGGGRTPTTNGVVSNVINYEQVGLTLKFKPLVFPNHDVQVAMEIESKDVAGAQTLTPTFTERTIKGTARIQNNKTLLLASVAQNTEANGRTGLPLLGLIPILGRLFTAPTKDNRQVDIVIAVTPRVIRAPAILPQDEIERQTGSLAVPTNSSLEAMIVEEDRQERLAAARRLPTNTAIQLPDQPAKGPEYVKTDVVSATGDTKSADTSQSMTAVIKPIDNSVKTLELTQTADTSVNGSATTEVKNADAVPVVESPGAVSIRFGTTLQGMKAGDKVKVPVVISGAGKFRSAVIGLKFDPAKVKVSSVLFGDLFGPAANTVATPFLNQQGKMYVSFIAKDTDATGVLAFIELEALAAGMPDVTFDRDVLNFMTTDGKNLPIKE